MTGFSDYMAENTIDCAAGVSPGVAIGSRFLALFTTAPTSDAGTGGTEVSGVAYARVQVAGALTAASTISTGSASITMPSNPGWVVPGMNVFDLTNAAANGPIGTVLTYVGTALTLTANASHNGTGATDSLQFSAFATAGASTNNEPTTIPSSAVNTNAIIAFAQAGAGGWGTVTSWGIYDALTSGNLVWWDYLGNFKWLPFTGTLASPSILTATAHGYSNGDPVVVTAKYGGVLPTAGSFAGVLTVAGVTTDTFNVGVNAATASGDGEVRKIVQQSIPANVTASFGAGTFTLSLA
jgi:hypothetical protein